jgi:flagella basal body P-ring formation protein FlgA
MRSTALFASLLFALCASAALAGAPVELKSAPVSHGAAVTLGDLFDDAGAASAVVVAHAAQPGFDAVLDADTVQMTAHRAGLDWANASGFHRIVVSSMPGGADAQPASHTHKASKRDHAAQALTYARNISAGDILSADDLVWSDGVVAPGDGVSNPEAAIGKAARHALRAGAAAAAHDLSSPRMIKRDDVVAVTFADEGISLTLQGKAMSEAAFGDSLTVTNPQSKKIIEAICTGPDQAVIGPAADAMRASSLQPGGQGRLTTASLR